MPTVFASFGQPILSPDGHEIWAYWADNFMFHDREYQIKTVDDLLGLSVFPSDHKTLYLNDKGMWQAGFGCLQKDFENSPMFLVSPVAGPKSVEQAVKILMKDKDFAAFFRSSKKEPRKSLEDFHVHIQSRTEMRV
jgi:hypothetical protein